MCKNNNNDEIITFIFAKHSLLNTTSWLLWKIPFSWEHTWICSVQFMNLWVLNLQFGPRLNICQSFMNYIKLWWYLHFTLKVSETKIGYIRKPYIPFGNFLVWQLALVFPIWQINSQYSMHTNTMTQSHRQKSTANHQWNWNKRQSFSSY